MSKIRRGGFVFVTWKGDHPPRHLHVYRDRRFVVKWDLDNPRARCEDSKCDLQQPEEGL
jgi:hypothetical protein